MNRHEAEAQALRASQHRAHTARRLAEGKATINEYRQARQAEDAAHHEADATTETIAARNQ